MAYLLVLLAALLLPYGALTAAARFGFSWASTIPPALAGCSGLALIFLLAGIAHFVVTRPMAEMIPPAIPFRIPLVYFTGLCELAARCAISRSAATTHRTTSGSACRCSSSSSPGPIISPFANPLPNHN